MTRNAARRQSNAERSTPREQGSPDRRRSSAPRGPNPTWTGLALDAHSPVPLSKPTDASEQEADRVADTVMRMPAGAVQRTCAACEDDERVQRKPDGGAPPVPAGTPAVVHRALDAPSQPLESGTRGFFEPRFGADLSRVRVHDDGNAAEAATALHARAFAVGDHIAFGRSQYQPGSDAGRRLLAHELTHVLQAQRAPAPHPAIARDRLSGAPAPPPGALMQEAHVVGDDVIVSTLEYGTEEIGEIESKKRRRLRHKRYVHVLTDDGIQATLEIEGITDFLDPSTPDLDAAAMLDVNGRGWVTAAVRGTVKRGAMRDWVGFDFFESGSSGDASMRAMALQGPRFMHFGLSPEEQVETLIDEIRRRLPPPARRHDTISDEDFKRLTPDEKAELAREALGDAIDLGNIARGVLMGLFVGALALGAIAAAVFGAKAVAIGLVIAAVVLAIYGIVSLLSDAIRDIIDRIADSDIGGAVLSILKGLAIFGAILAGALLLVGAVAAILEAPFIALGALALGALVLGVAALVIGLASALRDYQQAKDAADLKQFRKSIHRAARGIEGAITDAIVTIVTAIAGGYAKSRQPAQPPPPPSGPIIIEPPQVAPAAPPVHEPPQVAPAAPPVYEPPRVAGPTVMVPHVKVPPAMPAMPLKTTPLKAIYVGEDKAATSMWGTAVKYLNAAERAEYKLEFRNGKIYDAFGNLFDTAGATSLHSGGNMAIFVMDESGNFYAANQHVPGEFHHSSFLAGKPVAAAGELRVENGVLKGMTDQSGHYRPTIEFSDQAVKVLEAYGIDMTQVNIKLTKPVAAPAP